MSRGEEAKGRRCRRGVRRWISLGREEGEVGEGEGGVGVGREDMVGVEGGMG